MSKFVYGLSRYLQPFFDKDGGAGAGGDGAGEGSGGNGGEEGSGAGEGNSGGEKTFTQTDIDSAVNNRLAREKKKTDAAFKKLQDQLNELQGKGTAGAEGEGSGDQGANGEAQIQLAKAQTILQQANQKVIEATAHTEAIKLGVDPQYIADVVRLADLSGVEIGEDGSLDAAIISKAVDAVVKRVPAFKAPTAEDNQGSGFRVGGNGGGKRQQGSAWGSKQSEGKTETKRWNRWS